MTKRSISRSKRRKRAGPAREDRGAGASRKRRLLLLGGIVCAVLIAATVAQRFWGENTALQRSKPGRQTDQTTMATERSEPESVPEAGQRPMPPAPEIVPPEPPEALPATAQSFREESVEVARRLLEDFPNDLDAMIEAGIIHARHGNSAEAFRCWEQCLLLAPKRADIYNNMALLALKMEEYEKAAELCRKAVQINAAKPGFHYRLACALMELGDAREAAGALEKEIEISPKMSSNYYLLGVAHQQLKEYQQAKKNFETVLRIQPNHVKAYYGLVMVCARLGQKEESAGYREKFQKLTADARQAERDQRRAEDDAALSGYLTAETYTGAGRIYHQQRDVPTAETYWLRAAALDPKNAICRQQLTSLYAETNRYQEAVRMCEQLVAMDPNNAAYHINLGVLCTRLNRFDAALAAVQRALDLEPDNQQYRRVFQEIRERK